MLTGGGTAIGATGGGDPELAPTKEEGGGERRTQVDVGVDHASG